LAERLLSSVRLPHEKLARAMQPQGPHAMTEYHEMVKEAREARIGADRMAMGLPCIPDPLRGDMAEIERLRSECDLTNAALECYSDEQRRLRADNERLWATLEEAKKGLERAGIEIKRLTASRAALKDPTP
jgi:hypothetical protein